MGKSNAGRQKHHQKHGKRPKKGKKKTLNDKFNELKINDKFNELRITNYHQGLNHYTNLIHELKSKNPSKSVIMDSLYNLIKDKKHRLGLINIPEPEVKVIGVLKRLNNYLTNQDIKLDYKWLTTKINEALENPSIDDNFCYLNFKKTKNYSLFIDCFINKEKFILKVKNSKLETTLQYYNQKQEQVTKSKNSTKKHYNTKKIKIDLNEIKTLLENIY